MLAILVNPSNPHNKFKTRRVSPHSDSERFISAVSNGILSSDQIVLTDEHNTVYVQGINNKYYRIVLESNVNNDSINDTYKIFNSNELILRSEIAMVCPAIKSLVNKSTIPQGGTMDSLKDYLKQNKNVLFTVGLVLLLDHLVFKGAFRQKVQELLEGMLHSCKKELDKK